MNPQPIHLVSRKADVLDELERVLLDGGHTASRSLVVNGHVDPLHGLERLPEVVVLHPSHLWREELEAYAAHSVDRRPALIIVGAASDLNMMRLAMQAGARDVLPMPLANADFLQAIERLCGEHRKSKAQMSGHIDAFINAKGGCGATFLACNVAHAARRESKQRVAVIDLDVQFGAVPLYFDLTPKRGLTQALENLAVLDEVALEGYFAKHGSGLEVMSHAADQPLAMEELSANAVNQLLNIVVRGRERVIVDLPRTISAVSATVMERSRNVVLVLQQTMTALRDAARMLHWLRSDLMLNKDRLVIAVNRHDKSAPITLDDIRSTLNWDELLVVPNDFRTVSECVNSGTPVLEHARSSNIARAVLALESRLTGAATHERPNVFSRTFSNLLSGRAR